MVSVWTSAKPYESAKSKAERLSKTNEYHPKTNDFTNKLYSQSGTIAYQITMKQYFTKEVKIALTAIVAGVMLFMGINFLKGINIFRSSNTYYVKFKDIQGLVQSSAVYANGYPIGTVRDIEYNYENNGGVVAQVELDPNVRIPEGSHAELESSLMGGVTMKIILGTNPTKFIAQEDTIQGQNSAGLMDQAGELVPVVAQMLPKLDSILTNLNRLSADPALAQTLHNAAAITENLKTTSEHLDHMMQTDVPQMLAHFNHISGNLDNMVADISKTDIQKTMNDLTMTVSNFKELSAQAQTMLGGLNTKMNSTDNSLGLLLNDKGLYNNLNHTMASADSLLIDLKAHPKRYVHFSIFGKKDK